MLSKTNSSLAVVEVVKATTIKEERTAPNNINFDFSQYDFYEFDEFSQAKNSDEPSVIKGFNIFKKKKKEVIEEESFTEEEIQEDYTEKEVAEEEKSEETQEENIQAQEQPTIQEQQDEEIRVYQAPIKQSVKVSSKNKFFINADSVTYDDSQGNIYADGNVEIISKAQGVILKADKAVLDKEKQQIFLNDNVKIIKGGTEMRGESLIVDLNEQNILMDNPNVDVYSFTINAQEGYLIANDIQLLSGTFKRNTKANIKYMTRGFSRLDNMSRNAFFGTVDFDEKDEKELDVEEDISNNDDAIDLEKKKTYKINAKEIVITNYKDHVTVLLKDSDVYYNNHKIIRKSDFEIVSDRQKQVIEANIPELATIRGFGTYLGYGMVFKAPKGHTFKLMPTVALYEGETGYGIIGRYKSKTGIIDGGWNTASTELVVRGKYRLNDTLSLNFGRHAYIPEGFMGSRRSGYAAQLQYAQSYNIKDLNARFSNGIYAGIFNDYTLRNQSAAYSTTRFRYMAQLSKTLFKYKNTEQNYTMQMAANVQTAATVYGSGENHGIIRVGPTLSTRFKRWESSLGYFLSGEHGDSPFWFDKYRYGKSTVTINEKFHFSDYFALGFRLFVTPMRDNYQEKLLTESRFYAIIGPKDLKLALSYDFVRAMGKVDFMFIIGSDTSKINFDKLITKDFDGKKERKDFYQYIKPIKIEKPQNI